MTEPARTRLSLEAQKDKLNRILADRGSLYDLSVKKGHQTAAVALEKWAELDDIAATFAFLAAHQDIIREAVRRHLFSTQQQRDLADLEAADDATAELLAAARRDGAAVRLTEPSHQDATA